MDIIKIIEQEKDFRFAIWSKSYYLSNLDFLFEIICSSLKFDYNNLPKRSFKKGESVELTLSLDQEIKKLYFLYDGQINEQGINKIILKNKDSHAPTTLHLKTSQFIWRINKCANKDQKPTSNKQLKAYNIYNPPDNNESPIKVLSNSINIPYDQFSFFERTNILLLLDQSNENIVKSFKEWNYFNHSFLEYFPAYSVYEDNLKKINSEKFDRSEPERILFLFNNLSDLLDYINNIKTTKYFFIISDSYSLFFNINTQQYFIQTLLDSNFHIKVLYFGSITDFKQLNKNENVLCQNKIIKPIILDSNLTSLKKYKQRSNEVGDYTTNELINDCLNYSKKYLDINPYFSNELKKIIFNLCSVDRYKTEKFFKSLEKFCVEYSQDMILPKVKLLYDLIKGNKFKENIQTKNITLVSDLVFEKKINIIGKKEFRKEFILNKINKNYGICFIDIDFLNNFLYPTLLLNYISLENISFYLYSIENKIFKHTLNNFHRKYSLFYENVVYEEQEGEPSKEEALEDIKLFEVDYSIFHNNESNVSIKKFDAIEVESEDDKEEYISFFTKNYYPTIITHDSVVDISLEDLEIGHELVFLPGVKNVFQKFSEITENKKIRVELRNKWKEALIKYIDNHSFEMLIIQLKKAGIKRNKSTVLNWLNNKNVIGTQNPAEDFFKIANATNDPFLKDNYKIVAEVCTTLQRLSKVLGKRIKKLTIEALRGTNKDSTLQEYEPQVQRRIEEAVNGIKIVTVTNIHKNLKEVDYNLVNQLLEKDKLIEGAFSL